MGRHVAVPGALDKPQRRGLSRRRQFRGASMRLALLLSALAISCAAPSFAPVLAQGTEGPSKTFQGRDIFGIRTASDPQVRPDASATAHLRTAKDITIDNGRPPASLVV